MNINNQLTINAQVFALKTAYIYRDKKTTYGEFEASVNQFASGLKRLGYKKGDHIALVTWNNPYFLIAFYGALRIGVIVIPLNPRYTLSELRYNFLDGNVKAVITADILLNSFDESIDELSNIEHFIFHPSDEHMSFDSRILKTKVKSFTDVMESESVDINHITVDAKETAVILYTSGTTGHPKGAMLSHESIYYSANSLAEYLNFNENDRVIVTLPMYHVFGMAVTLNGPLLHGGTLLIVDRFSPKSIFEIANQHQATIFAGVPTMFNYLLQSDIDEEVKRQSFTEVRFSLSGGASMPLMLMDKFEKTLHSPVLEGYGLTEAASIAFNTIEGKNRTGSIGKCVSHVQAKVVDQTGKEINRGEKGELLVKGPIVMQGYYKLPTETANVLKNGWLNTGDIARMDNDGYIYIVDRVKDVIIVKGHNVYPSEVEETIYRHPDVIEVAVIGGPHPEFGEKVVAYVVMRKPNSENEKALIRFCRDFLTDYKIPEQVVFLEELPKSATGKVNKGELRQKLVG